MKLNNDIIKKRLKKLGFILLSEYKKSNECITISDFEGYKYRVLINNILRQKNARRFDKNNPYTIYNISIWLKLNNHPLTLITENYNGGKSKLVFRDFEGYLYTSELNNIINGQMPERFSFSNIYTIENINLWLKINNMPYSLLTDKYERSFHRIDIIDNVGYKYRISWNRISQHKQHEYIHTFHVSNPYTIENIKLWCKINDKQLELLSNEYKGNDVLLKWKCLECGKEFESIWNNILRGSGCAKCNQSKGEKKISEILYKENIEFKSQKEFKGLIGLGGGLLSYDFYLPKDNLLIEFQGIQHKKYIKYFHNDVANFKKQIEHDKMKRKFAKDNNINLLEIWYDEFDCIEDIIKYALYYSN